MKFILSILTCLIISFTSAQIVVDNLLLYYPFDGNAEDFSGNEYHATEFEVIYVEDRHGNPESAIYFNGIDSFIDFPNLPELKPDLPVSFAFWIKYEDLHYTNTELFNTSFEDDRSSGVYFNTQIATNKLGVNYGDGSYFYNPTARRSYVTNYEAHLDDWINVVVIVQSANNMKIYVNCNDYGGTYTGTGGNLVYSDTAGSLGRRDRDLGVPANYFKGAIDDFMYWGKALNSIEIERVCGSSLSKDFYSLDNSIKLYPNPAKDYFSIVSPITFDEIQIVDLTGKIVFKGAYSEKQTVRYLNAGVYIVSLINDEFVVRKKIVIK